MIKRKTLTSQVIDHIVGRIKDGEIKPGDRLPTETALTAELGVSRTCVREAMKSLESLGLISVRQRIGATVLEPSAANLLNAEQFSLAVNSQQTDDLIEFRKIMEVGLASLAAEKADEADLGAMASALDTYRAELATNRVDCNTDMSFHAALARASKNPIAQMVWQMLSSRLAEVLSKTMTLPHICEETLSDHEKIYRAIKSRDGRKAREAMRAHLENADRKWRIALGQHRSDPSLRKRKQDQRGDSGDDTEVPKRSHRLTEHKYPR
jgi:GntR family transcriptional regulator, transcriptional repressor for pyruvate dehydrogenase complex